MILSTARKNYTDDFRRQAVDLYESTPGATLRGIADAQLAERIRVVHEADKAYGALGSPPSSTTAPHRASRSTTNGRRE
jgi:transposase